MPNIDLSSDLWFDDSQLIQQLGGAMIAKNRAEAKEYVLKIAREQDVKFMGIGDSFRIGDGV